MCDPAESSQLKEWLFAPQDLELCRTRANLVARKYLAARKEQELPTAEDSTNNRNSKHETSLPVECFAQEFGIHKESFASENEGPMKCDEGNEYLNPNEEALLVSFYASKLPSLMGPSAQMPRLRREPKVPATAAMLLHRFYLSNSVMVHDPKTIMVSAAFLASKVEDAMTDGRYLEEGTNLMNAPVSLSEIIHAEIHLLSGVNFKLLCFHPYKAVLAITEDLRTYLKSEKGGTLVQFPDGSNRLIVGQDLKLMHDEAQSIVNDVVVSDIPMLYTPGQIGLAALKVANDQLAGKEGIPHIDIIGYISQRFETVDIAKMSSLLTEIGDKLQELKQGKHGCGKYNVDMQVLKGIHKKLKKVRLWGIKEKKKKRKKDVAEEGPDTKKTKT